MKVKLAKTAGFCMGVRRALETALRVSHEHNGPVATHGPLIHNPQVLELLGTKGVRAYQESEAFDNGCVIIRAHGVPMKTKEDLTAAGYKVVDATCPHVIRVQVILDKYTRKGYRGIIAGDADHPEVIGLLGHCYEGRGIVIDSPDDLLKLDPDEPAVLVAQTTHHEGAFDAIAEKARSLLKNVEVFRTICGATHLRQAEVQQIAQQVDCMIVVGGKNSGNTQRLAQIAADSGVPAFHVESAEELDPALLSAMTTVGVTAGASTPNWLIQQVVQRLNRIRGKGESGFRSWASTIVRFLLYTNIYIALGAAGISYASITLQGFQNTEHYPLFLAISSLYLYCIHLANHFLDKESDEYNDPDRGRFFLKNKNILAVTMVGAGLCALSLSWITGFAAFLVLAFITLMGILYSMPIVPASWTRKGRIRRIKDIPCSKTLSVTGGWVAVTTFLPALDFGTPYTFRTLFAMIFVAGLVFTRSAIIEVTDVQGDLVVGAETTPIVIGEKRTLRLLERISLFLLLFMPAIYFFGGGPSLFAWMTICCAYAATVVLLYKKQSVEPREWFEFITESNFILAGIITCLWQAFAPSL